MSWLIGNADTSLTSDLGAIFQNPFKATMTDAQKQDIIDAYIRNQTQASGGTPPSDADVEQFSQQASAIQEQVANGSDCSGQLDLTYLGIGCFDAQKYFRWTIYAALLVAGTYLFILFGPSIAGVSNSVFSRRK